MKHEYFMPEYQAKYSDKPVWPRMVKSIIYEACDAKMCLLRLILVTVVPKEGLLGRASAVFLLV